MPRNRKDADSPFHRAAAPWLVAACAAGAFLTGCATDGFHARGPARWSRDQSSADRPAAAAEAGDGGQAVDTIAGEMARAAEADRQIDEAFELVVQERYDEARVRLAELAHRFRRAEDDEHAARAMLWLAFCYEKTSKKNQAELFYQRILERYAETSAAQAARVRLEALDLPGDRARVATPPAESE